MDANTHAVTTTIVGADLELAALAAVSGGAFTLSTKALAAARARVRASRDLARRAMPTRSAVAGPIDASSAVEAAAGGARGLVASGAVPALLALTLVHRPAYAVPRAAIRTYALGAVGSTPSWTADALAEIARAVARAIIGAREKTARRARIAGVAMAGAIVAVPMAGAALGARLQRAVKAGKAGLALADGRPRGEDGERLAGGRLADAVARTVVRAHAQAAIRSAVSRLAAADRTLLGLVALAVAGAVGRAALEGAVGATKALLAATRPVKAGALAGAVGRTHAQRAVEEGVAGNARANAVVAGAVACEIWRE